MFLGCSSDHYLNPECLPLSLSIAKPPSLQYTLPNQSVTVPPLPPRVPLSNTKASNTEICSEYDIPDAPRQKPVTFPSKVLPRTSPSLSKTDMCKEESLMPVRTVPAVGGISEDSYEYETYSSTTYDGQNTKEEDYLITSRECSNTDFNIDELPHLKYLFTEINNLQTEHAELNSTIKLKQKRNTIQEAMINDLQKNRSLDVEHETRRKEIEALKPGMS